VKYLQGRFSVAVGGKEYRDGWEAIFGKKEEPLSKEADAALQRGLADARAGRISEPLTGDELAEKHGFKPLSPEEHAANIDREARRVLPGGGIRMPRGSKLSR